VVEESHLSIHTWPEHGYAAVDFFTCGDSLTERAHEVLAAGLKAQCSEIMYVDRGLGGAGRGIQLRSHHTEFAGVPPQQLQTARGNRRASRASSRL